MLKKVLYQMHYGMIDKQTLYEIQETLYVRETIGCEQRTDYTTYYCDY